ncbi:hypothetical protein RhoFasSB10_05167 [Rhodococcus fascians]|nr:hypothetical protein [Rhodococcus fascians]
MLDDSPPDLRSITVLIENLAAADHHLALRLIEHSAKRIASLLIGDPVRRWNDLFSLNFRVLGYAAMMWGNRSRLPAPCRPAARALVRELDHQKVANTLVGPQDQWEQMNFGVFIEFIENSDPTTFYAITDLIDFAKLEKSLAAQEGRPTRTGLYLCLQLSEQRADQVHNILDRLEPSLTELDPLVACIAPDVAARALERGLPLDLKLDHHRWGPAAEVLARLADHDAELAQEVIVSNRAGMIEGLINNTSTPFDNLKKWVAICDRLDSTFIDALILELPEGAVSRWDRAIRRPIRQARWRRHQIAPLVFRAARAGGHVQSEAEELIRRFPALARLRDQDATHGHARASENKFNE